MSSVYDKATYLLIDNKVEISVISSDLLTAYVESENEKYFIKIRQDGSFFCDCPKIMYSKNNSRHHFFEGKLEGSRILPECSHVLAVKLTLEYKTWIVRPYFIQKFKDKIIEDPTFIKRLNQKIQELIVKDNKYDLNLRLISPQEKERKEKNQKKSVVKSSLNVPINRKKKSLFTKHLDN